MRIYWEDLKKFWSIILGGVIVLIVGYCLTIGLTPIGALVLGPLLFWDVTRNSGGVTFDWELVVHTTMGTIGSGLGGWLWFFVIFPHFFTAQPLSPHLGWIFPLCLMVLLWLAIIAANGREWEFPTKHRCGKGEEEYKPEGFFP